MDPAQIRGAILFLGAFLNIVLVLMLWVKGKDRAAFHLGLAAFFSALFCFTFGGIFFFAENKLFWSKATWLGTLIVPASLMFVYSFTKQTRYFKLKTFLWYLSGGVIAFFGIATSYFIKDISQKYPFESTSGFLEPLGRLYIVLGGAVGLYYLFKECFRSKGLRRLQFKYFILGISIPSIGSFLAAGLIPLFYQKFTYKEISAILTVPGISLVAYAIFKKRLFAIRIILTEILVISISLVLLVQALLAENLVTEILGFIIFFSFILVGYLLIRVTKKEIERKEEAQGLAKELRELNETLEERVKERTKELEKIYFEIKQRKDRLERFYNLTVGREIRMAELKKEIQELKKKLEKKQ